MTRIDPLLETLTPLSGKRNKTAPGEDFQASLKEALTKTGKAGSALDAKALNEPQATHLSPITAASQEIVSRTEQLMSLLEHYATDLGKTDATLKDLEPLITRIKEEAEGLMAVAGSPGDQDAALQRIATETVLTAQVAYEKFQRGDFVD